MAKAKKKEITIEEALVSVEEQPYEVPENWYWVRLGSLNQYKTISVDPQKNGERTFELYSVPSSDNNFPEIVLGSEIGSSKQMVEKGDVLLCKINPRINRVWKVSCHTEHKSIASSEWIIVRNNMSNPDYLMYCFQSQFFREFMLSNVSGVGGSLMRAKPKIVMEYPIPIPPLSEQQRIVERIESLFSKLDEAKEKAQEALSNSNERCAAILKDVFNGSLSKKWREENNVDPESWKKIPFEDFIVRMQNGLSKRSGKDGKAIPVLRLANLGDDDFDISDLREIKLTTKEQNSYILNPNDIVMIRVNGSRDNVGKQLIIKEKKNWAFCDHIIRITVSDLLKPEFLVMFSKTDEYRYYIEEHMVSSAGQNTISRKGLSDLSICVPSISEQNYLVEKAGEMLEKERIIKDKIDVFFERIELTKKSILAKAFRGELGTNDPSEESAEELLKSILQQS